MYMPWKWCLTILTTTHFSKPLIHRKKKTTRFRYDVPFLGGILRTVRLVDVQTLRPMKDNKDPLLTYTSTIHVWNIYLHLVEFDGKLWQM